MIRLAKVLHDLDADEQSVDGVRKAFLDGPKLHENRLISQEDLSKAVAE